MVKNLPAMSEIWVQFLGWEDPLEKGMAQFPTNKLMSLCSCRNILSQAPSLTMGIRGKNITDQLKMPAMNAGLEK